MLLAYAAWNLAFLAFITPSKGDYYLLFATVPALLVAAAFLASPVDRLRLRAPLWAALSTVLVVGNLTRTASRITTNAVPREWLPVVDFVIASSAPTESVIASREFFFGFAGRRSMIDDYYYGSRTARLARWVVLERDLAPGEQEPDSDRFLAVAARYDRVFMTHLYEVFRLR